MTDAQDMVRVVDLVKTYRRGGVEVAALKGVSFAAAKGSFISIMGPSGSGKSTLLHLLGGLDAPTSGSVIIDGADLTQMNDEEITRFRRRKLGFVFQFFNLLPTMAAWENVALPLLLDGQTPAKARPRAMEQLALVGLVDRADHKPAQLSGGEMQRVAIARALVGNPALILADEPTGNLDSQSGRNVLDLLSAAVADGERNVIMVTHDAGAAAVGDRVIHLEDGQC